MSTRPSPVGVRAAIAKVAARPTTPLAKEMYALLTQVPDEELVEMFRAVTRAVSAYHGYAGRRPRQGIGSY
jgi:hypothetical protein